MGNKVDKDGRVYGDYNFIDRLVSIIKANKDKIIENIVEHEIHCDIDIDVCDWDFLDFDSDYIEEAEESIDITIDFINRFKLSIAEYLFVVFSYEDGIEEFYEDCDISEYLSLEEFKLIKKDILNFYDEKYINMIYNVILKSSVILFEDNKFEIPSCNINDIIERYYDAYNHYILDDYY